MVVGGNNGKNIVNEIFIYWGIFTILTIVILFFLIVIIVIFQQIFSSNKEEASSIFVIIFLVLSTVLVSPGSFYLLDYLGLSPPIDNLEEITSKQLVGAYNNLSDKVKSLQKLLESPEELKLSQLNSITQDTLVLADELQAQSIKQKKLIVNLQTKVNDESKKAKEAKKLVSELQSITKEQLNAIKLIITEDAKVESQRSFYFGLLLSFPLGVIASLTASFVYKKYALVIAINLNKIKKKLIKNNYST